MKNVGTWASEPDCLGENSCAYSDTRLLLPGLRSPRLPGRTADMDTATGMVTAGGITATIPTGDMVDIITIITAITCSGTITTHRSTTTRRRRPFTTRRRPLACTS